MTVKPQNTFMVSVPPRLSIAGIHTAIAAVDAPLAHISVMAASLTFATPLDICSLRALVEHAALHAEGVFVDCPTDPDVNRYLSRMDFYADLPLNVALSSSVPRPRRRDRRERLVELSRVRCGDDVQDFITRTWHVTKEQFGGGPMAKACATSLGAATENVLDHAASPIGALVAAQRYERTGLELAVVDLGVGIPTTLRRLPSCATLSDIEAVELALEDNVSSTGLEGRGAGLPELVAAIERAGNSTLAIRSGLAHVTISVRAGVREVQRLSPSSAVPGTWISVRLQP